MFREKKAQKVICFDECSLNLGELLRCLELLLQRGVLLLQGLHQGGLTLFVLLQGQDGGIELTDLQT